MNMWYPLDDYENKVLYFLIEFKNNYPELFYDSEYVKQDKYKDFLNFMLENQLKG